MSEPRSKARTIEKVAPGILNWHLHDDRIDYRSDAHAVVLRGKTVLIDPLPLTSAALGRLGKVEAICLTGSCHQRAAWTYRHLFGVKVWAPKGAQGLEESPDISYRKQDELPGGLLAIHAPGPTEVHYALHLPRGRGALFCADVLSRSRDGVRFVDAAYQDEPKRTRTSAKRFLDLRFAVLCFDHGAPITKGAHDAIRKALEADRSL